MPVVTLTREREPDQRQRGILYGSVRDAGTFPVPPVKSSVTDKARGYYDVLKGRLRRVGPHARRSHGIQSATAANACPAPANYQWPQWGGKPGDTPGYGTREDPATFIAVPYRGQRSASGGIDIGSGVAWRSPRSVVFDAPTRGQLSLYKLSTPADPTVMGRPPGVVGAATKVRGRADRPTSPLPVGHSASQVPGSVPPGLIRPYVSYPRADRQ